jgi:ElaA protein
VIRKRWSELSLEELYAFVKLRTDVFLVEQKVDEEELDWRDAEPATVHFWVERDGVTAAYLRVLEDAEPEHADARRIIGRVVVHPEHRGAGLAQQLLASVLEEWGSEAMLLHAQSYIAPLYARYGFEVVGEEYVEAGIPHLTMHRAAVSL